MLENLKIPEIKDVYISQLLKKKTEREIWEDWTLNWKKKQKFTNTTVKIGETACEVQTDFRDSRKRCTGRKEPGSHEILVMLARECLKMQKRWIYKKQEWWDWPEFLKPYLIRGDYWPKNIRKWDVKVKKTGAFWGFSWRLRAAAAIMKWPFINISRNLPQWRNTLLLLLSCPRVTMP